MNKICYKTHKTGVWFDNRVSWIPNLLRLHLVLYKSNNNIIVIRGTGSYAARASLEFIASQGWPGTPDFPAPHRRILGYRWAPPNTMCVVLERKPRDLGMPGKHSWAILSASLNSCVHFFPCVILYLHPLTTKNTLINVSITPICQTINHSTNQSINESNLLVFQNINILRSWTISLML